MGDGNPNLKPVIVKDGGTVGFSTVIAINHYERSRGVRRDQPGGAQPRVRGSRSCGICRRLPRFARRAALAKTSRDASARTTSWRRQRAALRRRLLAALVKRLPLIYPVTSGQFSSMFPRSLCERIPNLLFRQVNHENSCNRSRNDGAGGRLRHGSQRASAIRNARRQ